MEKKSYPELLHNICIEFGHGEKSRVDAFEKAIVLLIDQITTDEKKKLLPNENTPKDEHYLKNDNIKSDCESCSRHDIIVGCTLKHKNKCLVDEKYTKYRRGHLLPCDRCKTYSVITKIDRIPDNGENSIPRPAIKFICLKCKDYPLINKGIFKGYELRGMEFTDKYIRMYKQKEQREQKTEQTQSLQEVKSVEEQKTVKDIQETIPAQEVKPIEEQKTVKDIQETVPSQDAQQKTSTQDVQQKTASTQDADQEVEIVTIS